VKDTENMVEQRIADVRTVGWSLRQKEILGFVLDAIQSLRSSVRGRRGLFSFLGIFSPFLKSCLFGFGSGGKALSCVCDGTDFCTRNGLLLLD